MINTSRFYLTTCALCVVASAWAQDGKYSVEAGITTLGLTITPTYRYNDNIGFRAPIGYAPYSRAFEEQDITVNAKANLGGIGALVDYYPMDNGLRLTGGLMLPFYGLKGKSAGASTIVNDVEYAVSDFDAKISSSGVAPFLGFGYEYGSYDGGWGGSFDIGALLNVGYSGRYSYTATGLSASDQAQFENDVREIMDDALADLNKYGSILPYISFSVNYRF